MTAEVAKEPLRTVRRNPLSHRALTVAEVKPGVKFLCHELPPSRWKKNGWPYSKWYYERLMQKALDSMQWGEFTSGPYMEDDEHFVVNCIVDDKEVVIELFALGIVNYRYDTDRWANRITIAA